MLAELKSRVGHWPAVVIALSLVVSGFGPANSAEATESYSVSGILRDSAGVPVPSLQVYAYQTGSASSYYSSTQTAGDGSYQFDGLEAGGVYQIWTSPDETFKLYSKSFKVEIDSSSPANLTGKDAVLQKHPTGPGTVSGFVVGPYDDNGEFAEGQSNSLTLARVELNCQDPSYGGFTYTSFTDSEGQFSFAEIPNIPCELRTEKYGSLTRYVKLYNQDSILLDLEPGGSTTVSGTVSGGSSESSLVTGYVYMSFDNGTSRWSRGVQAAAGEYEISGVPAGAVKVDVWPQSGQLFALSQTPITVESGVPSQTFNFVLQAYPTGDGVIEGTVLDVSGQPVPATQINLNGEINGSWVNYSATPDDRGRFRVPNLAPGRYWLDTYSDRHYLTQVIINLNQGETSNRSIRLVPKGSASIYGQVSAAGATQLSNLYVNATATISGNTISVGAQVEDSGSYALPSLTSGTWSIRISGQLEGFYPSQSTSVDVPNVDSRIEFDTSLTPYPSGAAQLTVTVLRDTITGQPMQGLSTYLYSNSVDPLGTRTYRGVTDGKGEVSFKNLPAGTYSFYAWPQNRLTTYRSFTLSSTSSVSATVVSRAEGSAGVSGVVVDSLSKEPLANISVRMNLTAKGQDLSFWSRSATTNAEGKYAFTKVPTGEFEMSISTESNSGTHRPIYGSYLAVPEDGVSIVKDFELEPYPKGNEEVFGTLLGPTGVPISGARIQLNSWDGDYSRSYVVDSDENGEYSLASLPEGQYYLSAYKEGFMSIGLSVELFGQSPVLMDLNMKPLGTRTISGKVLSAGAGSPPLSNVVISANYSDGQSNWNGWTRSDSEGNYTLTGVPDGEIDLFASPQSSTSRHFSGEERVSVEGVNATFNIVLEPYPQGDGGLEIALTEAGTTTPIQGGYVYMYCSGIGSIQAVLDSEGKASFSQLPPGRCYLSIDSQGYLGIQKQVVIADTTVTINRGLAKIGSRIITGVVRASQDSSRVVPNAWVYASYRANDGRWSRGVQTASDGSYTINNAPNFNSAATFELRVSPYYSSSVRFFNSRPVSISQETSSTISRDIEVELHPSGSSQLNGTVSDRLTNLPIPGALIRASYSVRSSSNQYGWGSLTTRADQSGNYSFSELVTGQTYRIYANAKNYDSTRLSATISSDSIIRNITLKPTPKGTGSISGTVVEEASPHDKPVSRVWMRLQLDGSNGLYRTFTTSSTGKYQFTNLPEGSFTIQVYPNQYRGNKPVFKYPDLSDRRIILETSSTVKRDQTITLERYPTGTSSLSGQLWDSRLGSSVPGMWIQLTGVDFEYWDSVRTNSTGQWQFTNLPAGEYSYSYSMSSDSDLAYRTIDPRLLDLDGSESRTQPRDETRSFLIGSGPASLSVMVRDRDTHEPISGASVSIYPEDYVGGETAPSEILDGRISFQGLLDGKYRIYVWADGYINPAESVVADLSGGIRYVSVRLESARLVGTIQGVVQDDWGNPIADARVAATLEVRSTSLEAYYATSTTTDEDGNYVLTGVGVGRPVDFSIRVQGKESRNGGFAPYSEKITLSDQVALVRDAVLSPGAVISGQVRGPFSTNLQGLRVQALDSETKAWRGEARVASDGTYTIANLPPGTFKIFFSDDRWRSNGIRSEFGYLAGNASDSLSAAFSSASPIELEVGSSILLPTVNISAGKTITGSVEIEVSGTSSSYFQRWIEIQIERRIGLTSNWESYTGLNYFYSSGYEGGRFKIDGLPAGEYRLTFSEPWAGTTKLETKLVAGIDLRSNSVSSLALPTVIMTIAPPLENQLPDYVSLSSLDPDEQEALKDLISAPSVVAPGVELQITVGMDFVGEYVAVSIDSEEAAVSPSSLPNVSGFGNLSSFSLGPKLASFSGTDTEIEETAPVWYQVQADGTIKIPGITEIGAATVVVQDVSNQVIGWTSTQIKTGGSGAGGGFAGGGGGFAFPPSNSSAIKDSAPKVRGKLKVGYQLYATRGDWSSFDKVKLSYQWFRCMFPAEKSTTKPGWCSPIKGAKSNTFALTKKEAGKYIVARVTAKHSSGIARQFSASSQLVKPSKKKN